MSLKIPLVTVLLAGSLGLASADMGLVADIDGDYTNGPDTLLMDPGDTVQVNVWITGEDSLVGFGITLGDTSGALAWIEEADSLVYTTPSGWTNINIAQDSLGWILIQASDFAFSTPLVLPSKVAEMDFVVAPGESCGVIAFDPEMSGWQDWDFHEDSYSQWSGVACWDMGTEGQGSEPQGGGSNDEDESPQGADQGLEALHESLQVPAETLAVISTYDLVGMVTTSPFCVLMWAHSPTGYSEEIDSYSHSYNGLQELLEREDAATSLLTFYRNTPVVSEFDSRPYDRHSVHVYTLEIIEALLADERIIRQFDSDTIRELLAEAIDKYTDRVRVNSRSAESLYGPPIYTAYLVSRCLDHIDDPDFALWIADSSNAVCGRGRRWMTERMANDLFTIGREAIEEP
ncbi:MAG: hypothetical protein ABIJ00_08325 [Candidatus Eisenbacteria bacterium]